MRIAIIGATGLVGREILKSISSRARFDLCEIVVAASPNSVGKKIDFRTKSLQVVSVEEAIALRPEIAIFSAGGAISKKYAPLFAAEGAYVVDNSSAWRMEKDSALVVPEINAKSIFSHGKIIANPNCSTIQMVMVLAPIHRKYGIKRLVISTYQSVTGSGVKGENQLLEERSGAVVKDPAYPHPIDMNVIPHGGDFEADGYTTEETKLVNETRKILDDAAIQITATVVRVPVVGGHSISVNVETCLPFDLVAVVQSLNAFPGLTVQDDPASNLYPMPRFSHQKDDVFVGRIRRDNSCEHGLNLWIVADNLRKGAATNAVQIAEYLLENKCN